MPVWWCLPVYFKAVSVSSLKRNELPLGRGVVEEQADPSWGGKNTF
jgi:hypothetical protein